MILSRYNFFWKTFDVILWCRSNVETIEYIDRCQTFGVSFPFFVCLLRLLIIQNIHPMDSTFLAHTILRNIYVYLINLHKSKLERRVIMKSENTISFFFLSFEHNYFPLIQSNCIKMNGLWKYNDRELSVIHITLLYNEHHVLNIWELIFEVLNGFHMDTSFFLMIVLNRYSTTSIKILYQNV